MTEFTPTKGRIHDGQECKGNASGWIEHTLLEIQEYAALGCLICLYHAEAVAQRVPRSKSDVSVGRNHELFTRMDIGNCPCDIELFHCEKGKGFVMPEGYRRGRVGVEPRNAYRCEPPNNLASKTSLEWAKVQIGRCIKCHVTCDGGTAAQLPFRLLDVGTKATSTIRLREFGNDSWGSWVCLSHCWGIQGVNGSIVRTTSDRLERFKQSIPWELLPKTFRHAVEVTRRLGLVYLWIDSLCIIQDDPEDWAGESSKMASIYRKSYLTIAATTSASPSRGLFDRDIPRFYAFHELRIQDSPLCDKVYVRQVPPHLQTMNSYYTGAFPLLRRAWVYQERLLSPRILHFAGYELIFECNKSSNCQCSPEHCLSPADQSPKIKFESIRNENFGIECNSPEEHLRGPAALPFRVKSPRSRFELWFYMVHAYSKLDLTYPADVLPALSGVAKTCNPSGRDRYFAGLWLSTLTEGLLWCTYPTKQRPSQYLAPTWSWASAGPSKLIFRWNIEQFDDWAIIKDIHCVLKSSDYTGAVKAGHLILSSQALPGFIHYSWGNFGHVTCQVTLENDSFKAELDYTIWESGPGYIASGSPIQITAIGAAEIVEPALKCLLLRQVATDPSIWERCGALSIDVDTGMCTQHSNYSLEKMKSQVQELWKTFKNAEIQTFKII